MQPPLIDRELFFGNPEITNATLSPDGRFVAFVKPWNGTLNIWVKLREEPFGAARLMTTEPSRPVADYLWTRDSRFIVYVRDKEGDENYNAYAVDPTAAPAEDAEAPASRDLTGLSGVQVHLYSAPKQDPDVLYIGLNDRDPAWHDLYRLRISTGERTLLRTNDENVAGWFFDLKGNLRLAFRIASNGDQQMLRVDPDGLTPVYTCSVFEHIEPLRFHPDGRHVYLGSNKGDDVDLSRLELFDLETGAMEPVESDPLGRVDFGGAAFHEESGEIIYTAYDDDRLARYFRDKEFEGDFRYVEAQLPGMEIEFESRTRDERVWMITAASDVEPGETFIFDRDSRRLESQFRVRAKVPREALSPMTPIRYASSDGLEIPAYLVLPVGCDPRNLPVIAYVHGGPWHREDWGYDPTAQFFANRGYAVLMPNFRGSTGYGKHFLNAGNAAWGREMQDDITFGVKHLIAQGIADPKRVAIFGGSYGGYAALAGVAFTPGLYAAAVDIVGPSNLHTMLDSIPPYWEAGRKLLYARMADPTTPEGKAWLDERSPLFSADKIVTPLLVVQGANDPRVSRAEAEQIVIALRDRGFPVEYILAEDEGHGFARPVNNMAMYMATEKFLATHLGGRFQPDGSPEVVERLQELTIDPATVTLTRKVDPASVVNPAPVATLTAGKARFKAGIEVQGESIPASLTTTVGALDGNWQVVEELSMMGMSMSETSILDGPSLTILHRHSDSDEAKVDLHFAGGRATGSIDAEGSSTKIDSDTGGPVIADGPGFAQVIACFPLNEGYAAYVRNFDAMKQRVRVMRVAVDGLEDVKVPAGSFRAWKVELTSASGGQERSTIWVDSVSRIVVKTETLMPEMGGAVLRAERMA